MAHTGLLAGRLALVTGAGSGIGRAVCQVFAREGAKLAAVDQNDKGLAETIKAVHGENHTFTADISNSASVTTLMQNIQTAFKRPPCCVVNCAGILRDSWLLKMEESQFDDVIRVNLKGTYLVTQAVSRLMVQHKLSGSIVNISSIAGKVGNMGQCNYSASKAGVMGFTKAAAKELAKHGIRCNAILPGLIDTPMTETVPEKVQQLTVMITPLGRTGKPEEIAETCLFLISNKSSYITGQCIDVTGGLFM